MAFFGGNPFDVGGGGRLSNPFSGGASIFSGGGAAGIASNMADSYKKKLDREKALTAAKEPTFDNMPVYQQYENSLATQPRSVYENMLSQRALGTGPSKEAQYLMQQQQAGLGRELGNIRGQAGAGVAQAQQQLAMRGGIAGGARERLAGSAYEQAALQAQAARGGVEQARLGTLAQDEATRRGLLGNFAQQSAREREIDVGRGFEEHRLGYSTAAEKEKLKQAAIAAQRLAETQRGIAGQQQQGGGSIFSKIPIIGGLFG